jgi:methionyl-tRNA formyltransferase
MFSLRGPAPIHHALLLERPYTGVTLQTLHPSKFDHGKILAQSQFPGIEIPSQTTPEQLTKLLGVQGAALLREALENRVFVPPLQPLELSKTQVDELTSGNGIAHAPKITPEDRKIDWEQMTSREILHRSKILGDLWDITIYHNILRSNTSVSAPEDTSTKRIKYSGFHVISSSHQDLHPLKPGTPFLAHRSHDGSKILEVGMKTVDGSLLVKGCTIAGEGKNQGEVELVRLMKKYGHTLVEV